MTNQRIRVAALATTALALLGALACSDQTITDPFESQDPAAAADRLGQLADSVASLEGEAAALPLRDAADQLRAARKYSVIPLTVDDKTERWLAFSTQQVITLKCATAAAGATSANFPCGGAPIVTRTLVAWQPGDPRRMMVLTTPAAPDGSIANSDRPTTATAVPAFLRYFEGRDQVWFGRTGHYVVNVVEGDPCPSPAASSDARLDAAPSCRLARFTWALREVTVAVPTQFAGVRQNLATGTHTIALAPSEVAGAIVSITLVARPPVNPLPVAGLVGDVAVSNDGSALQFTFTVKNTSDRAIEAHFNTGQQYDFVVGDRGGRILWRWSADKAFPQTPSTRIFAAHESAQFKATWTPTGSGELMVGALLTSRDVRLAVRSPFTIP